MRYEVSLPHEIDLEIDRVPVAYVPWGAHEWHGPHNPVGLDGLKAQYLAEQLCAEVGGVVLPSVFSGHGTIAQLGFRHSISFSAELVERTADELLNGIAGMGFKVIVLVLGHWGGGHGDIIRKAASKFNESQSSARAWAVQDDETTGDLGTGDDHGGLVETSYMMSYLPGRVDLSRLPEDRETSFSEDGVLGEDPRKRASAEFGRNAAALYVQEAAQRVREMLAGF